jgi:ATPase family associated with various cellular activities (AAA)
MEGTGMTEQDKVDPWTTEAADEERRRVSDLLAEHGKSRSTLTEKIERRKDGGKKIALPVDMDLDVAEETIREKKEAEQETYEFSKTFLCKPPDGAWNFTQLLSKLWDTPIGKATRGWFASPPQMISVEVNRGESYNVPWGTMYFKPWETTFELGAGVHREYGLAFQVSAYGKLKYEADIANFFLLLEDYLKENSIYAGKAMRNVTTQPEFIDPYVVDRETIAFSTENWWELQAHVYGLIENHELIKQANAGYEVVDSEGNPVYELRENGEPRMRNGKPVPKVERTHIKLSNNVLLSGDNGGGKTCACAIAGQYCLEHGWNFVEISWDEDLVQATRFVQRLEQPTLMVLEDVEHLFKNPQAMDKLLGEFDGMRTKGYAVTLLMTTNHPEEIPKSMKGGHRIDHTITIAGLDQPGVQRLIDSHIPESQRVELDYSQLFVCYEGWMPAFIVRSLEDVVKHNIIRTGKLGQPLATEDFLRAAGAMRSEIDAHSLATDRPTKPALVEALSEVVRPVVEQVLQSHMVDLQDGEIMVRG